MKHFVRVTALVLLLSLFALPLGGCSAVRNPLRYAKKAAERTFAASPFGEISERIGESLSNGSVSFSFSGIGEENGLSAGEMTAYFTSDRDRIVLTGNATLGGQTYDAEIFLEDGCAVVRSSAFLGSSTLGIPFDTLEKDVAASVFRNNSGTVYAIPDVDGATAGEIRSLSESFFSLYSSVEEMGDLADDVVDTFLENLEKYARTVYYRKDGRIELEVTVENGDLSKAIRATRAQLINNRKFCREVREWAKTYDELRSSAAGVVTNAASQKAEYFLTNDATTEALCAMIDISPAFQMKMNTTIRILTRTMERFSLSLWVGDTERYGFSFCTGDRDITATWVTPKISCEFSMHHMESNRKLFRAELECCTTTFAGAVTVVTGTVSIDKKTDMYTLAFNKGEETHTVSGTYLLSRKNFRLSVDSVTVGEAVLPCRFAVEAKVDDKAPETPEYTNLFAIDGNRFSYIDTILAPAKEQFMADFERFVPNIREKWNFFADTLGLPDVFDVR